MSSRADHLHLAKLLDEVKRRQARKEQSAPGGLMAFIRYFWRVLEPETPLVEGWTMDSIAEHLESVTAGEICRLLINVPPGFCKSLITNVFWPAWEWGPMNKAHLRYVTFSYSASLTMRDNGRFRDLILSPEYQALWGNRVQAVKIGDVKISNMHKGWKLASSVGGVGTGERGDRIICFPADQLVQTELGRLPIGDIVDRRQKVRAWSFNQRTGDLELRPIIGWHKNPGRALVRVTAHDGSSVVCTHDHEIYTANGLRAASSLVNGDYLFSAPSGMFGPPASVILPHRQIQVGPYLASTDASDSSWADPIFSGQNFSRFSMSLGNLPHQFLRQMRCAVAKGAMYFAIRDILRSRPVFEVVQSWVRAITILVSNFLIWRVGAGERQHYQLVNHAIDGLSIDAQCNARVSINEGPSHYLAGDFQRKSGSYNGARKAANPAKIGDFIGELDTRERAPVLLRVRGVEFLHDVPPNTYCITVERNHNLICGTTANIICSNCDDLNNVKESESETVRDETNRWFRESMSNRLNNLETGAIVIICQRVHGDDVSGMILELGGLNYEHLRIPMEFDWAVATDDSGQPKETSIGWYDPRWQPLANECDGELAWPERFSQEVIDQTKHAVGPFAYAGQYQQRPSPRGGAIFKEEWWQLWHPEDGKFPTFEYIVASLDSAFTKDTQNDPSALTVWGVFLNENGQRRLMLINAWRKFLEMHGPRTEKRPDEHVSVYRQRSMQHWGLVEWVADTCRIYKADRLLIEAKASGITAGQEIQRLHGREGWAVQLCPVKGDKVARALAVVPTFSQMMIYAPELSWSQMVIDEMATFPKGKYDDLTDSATQAIKHLRDVGLAQTDEEVTAEEHERVMHRPRRKALYPV